MCAARVFCSWVLPHSASRVGCHDGQSVVGEERGEGRGVPVNASSGRTVKCGSKG